MSTVPVLRRDDSAWKMRTDLPTTVHVAVWPHGGHTYHASPTCGGIPDRRHLSGVAPVPVEMAMHAFVHEIDHPGGAIFCGICLVRRAG